MARRAPPPFLIAAVAAAAAFGAAAAVAAGAGKGETKLEHWNADHIYNHTIAEILVKYASAVYVSDLTALFTWTCSRCHGMIEGFEMKEVIVDALHCLQAFVGVAPDLNSIIVAFRGTKGYSLRNWIEDLYWKQLDLSYPGMQDAMVHHGFYSAYHNTTLRRRILSAVKWVRKSHGNIPIILVGHSMGGALASFCALDLAVNYGVDDVRVMTFGQPRVGNAAFASYFNRYVPRTIRVTHEKDIVPHLPPYRSVLPGSTYHHFAREVWLHSAEDGDEEAEMVEKVCDSSGEDPTCSRSVYGDSILDHLKYFDADLRGDSRGSCAFIIDDSMTQYSYMDNDTIVLSKNPKTPSYVESS